MSEQTAPVKRPPGRPKGSKNKVSKEARAFFLRLWRDKEFRKKFQQDWKALKVPPNVMVQAAYYAFGKPVEQMEIDGPGGAPLTGPVSIVINGKTYTSGSRGRDDGDK